MAIINSSTLNAASVVQFVQPNKRVPQGWQFEVNRTQDRNPVQSKFKVEIIPKNAQIPVSFTVSLSLVQIKREEILIKSIRKLNCSTKQTIVCNFTVPNEALKNPNLAFVLNVPVMVNRNGKLMPMPSSSLLYFQLKDIPQSDISSWHKLWFYIDTIVKQIGWRYAS